MHIKKQPSIQHRRGQAPKPQYSSLLVNLCLFFDALHFLPLLWQESDAPKED